MKAFGPLIVLVLIVAAGCGDDDTPTEPATTASATTAPATSTATTPEVTVTEPAPAPTPAKTVAQIEAELRAELVAGADPTVVTAVDVACEGDGSVQSGEVLTCQVTPSSPSGELIQAAEYTVVVLSDDGRWAASGASGPPNWRAAPSGLDCEGFFYAGGLDRGAPPYDTPPGDKYAAENYLYTLAYFFTQGRPAVMDADGNGVPCETVYPADVVDLVWSGGVVTVPY